MKMKIRNKAAFTDVETGLERDNRRLRMRRRWRGSCSWKMMGPPLKPGKIALYGAGAGMTIKGGTGSGEVRERHVVSILEGMEKAGFTVTTQEMDRRVRKTLPGR